MSKQHIPVINPISKMDFEGVNLTVGMQLVAIHFLDFAKEPNAEIYALRHLVITQIKPSKKGGKQLLLGELKGTSSIIVKGNDLYDLTAYKPPQSDSFIEYHRAAMVYNLIMLESDSTIRCLYIRQY